LTFFGGLVFGVTSFGARYASNDINFDINQPIKSLSENKLQKDSTADGSFTRADA
jgi:hypothetical protein